ncbi:cell division cycle protein 27-like protein B [Iris pallida]|uniref:Cell division cycle protein 27-like protein B n=1 Tax=Iris pallida TaxID=29817 RepID=A0AAX6GV25_IRIPA|nr:cell division cycle protein 27-like protein B [Iris pallida]KAJ6843855.1 cell division cycle protein 27-like protein B [Iris pallida]
MHTRCLLYPQVRNGWMHLYLQMYTWKVLLHHSVLIQDERITMIRVKLQGHQLVEVFP